MNRISWDEYALNLASAASLRSEDPYVKVGSCVLSKDHRVLSVGYNGLPPGLNVSPDFWNDRDKRRPMMIHAEVNSLSLVKRTDEPTLLACTLLPCTSCAQMIAAYGIKRVVFRDNYSQDMNALNLFQFYGIELIKA